MMNAHPFLLVIPSIDIKDGKTVRVVQGIPELNCREYGDDPVEMAMLWRAENAKMIHVVDFDGAIDHSSKNLEIVEKICSSVVIPVEFAGGVRTIDDAKAVLDKGVSRIAVNTMALENPREFLRLLDLYGPGKIVICLDVVDKKLVTRGRNKKTDIDYIRFAVEMAQAGVKRFIVTDVKRNGLLQGPNIEYSLEIAGATNCKVTHSGGIRNKDELMDLQLLIGKGIDSAIVGRAFYENRFPCQKLWRVAESGIFN